MGVEIRKGLEICTYLRLLSKRVLRDNIIIDSYRHFVHNDTVQIDRIHVIDLFLSSSQSSVDSRTTFNGRRGLVT